MLLERADSTPMLTLDFLKTGTIQERSRLITYFIKIKSLLDLYSRYLTVVYSYF